MESKVDLDLKLTIKSLAEIEESKRSEPFLKMLGLIVWMGGNHRNSPEDDYRALAGACLEDLSRIYTLPLQNRLRKLLTLIEQREEEMKPRSLD